MIRGHRWVLTGNRVWQLESTPRRFHGTVSESFAYVNGRIVSDGVWRWHTGFASAAGEPSQQGEAGSRREAMRCVEKHRRQILYGNAGVR